MSNFVNTPSSPVSKIVQITPSDTTVFEGTKGIMVVSGGSITFVLAGDPTPVTLANLPALTELSYEVVKLLTSTTASVVIGYY